MRSRVVLTVLAAILVPVALALAVYASAAGSLGVEPAPVAITTRALAEPAETTTDPTTTGRDVSGNCDEAEHANDPECEDGDSRNDDDDSDDDDSENSGRGSENSGSGSGDD